MSPADGATVTSPVTVRFGLEEMGVAPAGVDKINTGHHHLLIDVAEMPPLDMPLPTTDQIRHFGGGQTEVQLDLEPGEHTLQLVLGDYLHIPHDPPLMVRTHHDYGQRPGCRGIAAPELKATPPGQAPEVML